MSSGAVFMLESIAGSFSLSLCEIRVVRWPSRERELPLPSMGSGQYYYIFSKMRKYGVVIFNFFNFYLLLVN